MTTMKEEKHGLGSRAPPRKAHERDPFLSLDIIDSPSQKLLQDQRPKKTNRVMADRLSIGNSNHVTPRNISTAESARRRVTQLLQPTSSAENDRTKRPFKHAVESSQIISKRTDQEKLDPSSDLTGRTVMAAFHVQQTIGRLAAEANRVTPGRRQKARMSCMNPVHVVGPSMEQCRGVVADRRLQKAAGNVEHRGYLVASLQQFPGLLTQDAVLSVEGEGRPESVHQPSEASSDAEEETERLRLMALDLGQSEMTTGLAAETDCGDQQEAVFIPTDGFGPSRPVTQPAEARRRPAPSERPRSVHFAAATEVFPVAAPHGTTEVALQ